MRRAGEGRRGVGASISLVHDLWTDGTMAREIETWTPCMLSALSLTIVYVAQPLDPRAVDR